LTKMERFTDKQRGRLAWASCFLFTGMKFF
jgi:hypothetical protein